MPGYGTQLGAPIIASATIQEVGSRKWFASFPAPHRSRRLKEGSAIYFECVPQLRSSQARTLERALGEKWLRPRDVANAISIHPPSGLHLRAPAQALGVQFRPF